MSEERDKPVNIAGELCGHLKAAGKLVEELSGIEVAIEITPVRP